MSRRRILVADDSRTALMMESMALKASYELITASNGEEAVAKAVAELPDLVILDVVMPGLNGFEACRLLRGNPATHAIPIIMVTTRGEAENVEAGWRAGCSDYVTKPIDRVELLAKVDSLLGAGGGA